MFRKILCIILTNSLWLSHVTGVERDETWYEENKDIYRRLTHMVCMGLNLNNEQEDLLREFDSYQMRKSWEKQQTKETEPPSPETKKTTESSIEKTKQ